MLRTRYYSSVTCIASAHRFVCAGQLCHHTGRIDSTVGQGTLLTVKEQANVEHVSEGHRNLTTLGLAVSTLNFVFAVWALSLICPQMSSPQLMGDHQKNIQSYSILRTPDASSKYFCSEIKGPQHPGLLPGHTTNCRVHADSHQIPPRQHSSI